MRATPAVAAAAAADAARARTHARKAGENAVWQTLQTKRKRGERTERKAPLAPTLRFAFISAAPLSRGAASVWDAVATNN